MSNKEHAHRIVLTFFQKAFLLSMLETVELSGWVPSLASFLLHLCSWQQSKPVPDKVAALFSNSCWQGRWEGLVRQERGWECSQPLEVSVTGIPAVLVPLCYCLIGLCSAARMGWQVSVLILGALAHAAVPGGSCGSCGCNWEGQHLPEAWSQDYSSVFWNTSWYLPLCFLLLA